jgi:hypothetical protein
MLKGAAVFEDVLGQVTGSPVAADWYSGPVMYLVDTGSLVPPADLWRRARAVTDLLTRMAEQRPGLRRYTDHGPPLTRVAVEEAMAATGQSRVAAAWRTPERALDTGEVATRVRAAVADRAIPSTVGRVARVSAGGGGWSIGLEDGRAITARAVVNCLWESRSAIDRQLTHDGTPVSIRYKLGLFGSTPPELAGLEPSTRILGAYGDVTPYGTGNIYLSWYPAGLVGRSDSGDPPAVPPPDEAAVRAATIRGLGLAVAPTTAANGSFAVRGGYVVARGWGDITDRASPLHERRAPDARLLAPRFVSVDTGKYSLGPLLASRAARLALDSLRGHG